METGGSEVARRTVTACCFDDRAVAQKAVDDLAAVGSARDRVTLLEGGVAAAFPCR